MSFRPTSIQKRDRSSTFRGKSGTPDLYDLAAFSDHNMMPGKTGGDTGFGWENDDAPGNSIFTGRWLLALVVIAILLVAGAFYLVGLLREEPEMEPRIENPVHYPH